MKQFTADRGGATAMEYALIATLLSVMIITGATSIGTKLSTFFTSLGPKIK